MRGDRVIFVVARYGFKTADNDIDGYNMAFLYGVIALGALFGHAVGVRVWRYSKLLSVLICLAGIVALTINLSNSLGAIAAGEASCRPSGLRRPTM